jgi:uncharacterized GH25 family protein
LERAAVLAGVVVDQAGEPVAGVKVHVVVADGGRTSNDWWRGPAVTSDRSGKFTLKGLDPNDTISLRARSEQASTDGAMVVVPSEQKGPLRLVVSEGNAFRLRGVVMDDAGRPIPEAKVGIEWERAIVSRRPNVGSSIGGVFQNYHTGTDGIFAATALWPGDRYRVEATAEGYSKAGSPWVTGKAGAVHDFGRVVLARAGAVVLGRVVDSAGAPVAGVRVFNSGDAPFPVSARTDAKGTFRLENLHAGSVYVFGHKEGFRFTGVRVASGGPAITIKLLKADEKQRAAKQPAGEFSFPEQRATARKLLERLWALPAEQRRPIQFQLVAGMTRLDPAQGLLWGDQAGPRYLEEARITAAKGLSGTDAVEAVAMLAQVGNYGAYLTLRDLGERYVKSSPAKALLFVEEGVVRARALDQPSRTYALASLGSLVRQLGKEQAGRKLIDDAAAAAATMGKDQELALGMTAEALAPYDLPRALALLGPLTDRSIRERWLGRVAVAIAGHDLDKALEIPKKFEKISNASDRVRMRIAYLIAASQPAKAIQVAESMDSHSAVKVKTDTFAWMAVAIAPTDRKLAFALIDRTMALFEDEAEALRGFSNNGGRSVMAARLFGLAREIGYPDLESLAYRVMALRPTLQEDSPARVIESLAATAMVLALAEPAMAKQILEGIEPRGNLVGTGYSSIRKEHFLMAWALSDHKHASELFEKTLAARLAEPNASLEGSGLVEMAGILTVAPPDRALHMLRYFGSFWFPGEE